MKAYVVERDRLRNNIDVVKRKADGRAVYAVLKGNGYGLGMLQFAHELRDCGIERFAVTEPTDAIKLRLAGFIDEEILVMRSTADERDIADILEAKAVATIGSYEAAVVLNGMAEKRGEVVEAHIKIDTGMGRYGFRESETDKILSIFRFMPKIAVSGVYSHSNMAFSGGHTADDQLKALLAAAEAIHAAGFDPGIIHFANSAFLFGHDISGTDAVRIGSAFWAVWPDAARPAYSRWAMEWRQLQKCAGWRPEVRWDTARRFVQRFRRVSQWCPLDTAMVSWWRVSTIFSGSGIS